MGERKGVNKYYPPDYDPARGGLNKWQGTHALRERARKLHLGILVIRFEMPYNIWCDGCGNHIGMGVRYNAEKSKVGMYYTTPIYKFRMKCHLCDNHFEIQTDPANLDYVVLCGARRQERRFDPAENGTVVPEERSQIRRLAADSMFRLQHEHDDRAKLGTSAPAIARLHHSRRHLANDYAANSRLRQANRMERREAAESADRDSVLLAKSSLDLPLLQESEHDRKMAALIRLQDPVGSERRQQARRAAILAAPVLGPTASGAPASGAALGFGPVSVPSLTLRARSSLAIGVRTAASKCQSDSAAILPASAPPPATTSAAAAPPPATSAPPPAAAAAAAAPAATATAPPTAAAAAAAPVAVINGHDEHCRRSIATCDSTGAIISHDSTVPPPSHVNCVSPHVVSPATTIASPSVVTLSDSSSISLPRPRTVSPPPLRIPPAAPFTAAAVTAAADVTVASTTDSVGPSHTNCIASSVPAASSNTSTCADGSVLVTHSLHTLPSSPPSTSPPHAKKVKTSPSRSLLINTNANAAEASSVNTISDGHYPCSSFIRDTSQAGGAAASSSATYHKPMLVADYSSADDDST